jgi:uncharacterized protein (DUF2336 family)
MYDRAALLTELDASLAGRTPNWRASALRQLTALLVAGDRQLSAEHLAVFDLVFPRMIEGADPLTVSQVSELLARSPNAPPDTIDLLAKHSDPAISIPVVKIAAHLSDECLIERAANGSHEVLLAIAARSQLGANVADEVIRRGDKTANRVLFDNPGASISELGFVKMIDEARSDGALLAAICARSDLPAELRPFFEATATG